MTVGLGVPGLRGRTLFVCDSDLAARIGDLVAAEERQIALAATAEDALEMMHDPSIACVVLEQPAATFSAAILEARSLKDQELDAFAYAVSHDLRAPLRSVDGFSAALVEHAEGALDPKARDYLGRIRAAAVRMSDMIEGLLALHRMSRATVTREPVDLSALASRVAAALAAADPARQVTVTIQPGLAAEADRGLMTRVLEELIGNSWKFTSKVERAVIEVGATVTAEATTVIVRDNGDGFDPAYSGKMFRPFQRFHRATDYPGRGLGLAFAARLVERHGGRVQAQSAPGVGTTIQFTLPTARLGGRS